MILRFHVLDNDAEVPDVVIAYPNFSPSSDPIHALSSRLTANYCIVAATALLWADFVFTFSKEVRCIWGARFTGATVVYLCTRYAALIAQIYFVLTVFLWNSTNKTCDVVTRGGDILLTLNYFALSSFTMLRGYAISGFSWKPLVLIVPLVLLKPTLYAIQTSLYHSVQGGPPFGCLYIYHDLTHKTWTLFTIAAELTSITAEVIVVALTWHKTFEMHKQWKEFERRRRVSKVLLVDGTVYFVVIMFLQVATMVSNSFDFLSVWTYFGDTLMVIFHSRFMLDLRGISRGETTYTSSNDSPGTSNTCVVPFMSSVVVGNLGAHLCPTLDYAAFSCGNALRDNMVLERRTRGSLASAARPQNSPTRRRGSLQGDYDILLAATEEGAAGGN